MKIYRGNHLKLCISHKAHQISMKIDFLCLLKKGSLDFFHQSLFETCTPQGFQNGMALLCDRSRYKMKLFLDLGQE